MRRCRARHATCNGSDLVMSKPLPEEHAVRFWSRVTMSSQDECWLWLGTIDRLGYGEIHLRGSRKRYLAHRLSWEIAFGPIPAGQHHGTTCVLHRCDNPPCVNPHHLFLGTQLENIADRNRKKRARGGRGIRNCRAKLTWPDVVAIRTSIASNKLLGRELGVRASYIWAIRNNKARMDE